MAMCLGAYPAVISLTVHNIFTISHSILLFSHTMACKIKPTAGVCHYVANAKLIQAL